MIVVYWTYAYEPDYFISRMSGNLIPWHDLCLSDCVWLVPGTEG